MIQKNKLHKEISLKALKNDFRDIGTNGTGRDFFEFCPAVIASRDKCAYIYI